MEPHEVLYEDFVPHEKHLSGLARTCPGCRIVAHYDVKTRKLTDVRCPMCNYQFQIKKYRKGERPKCR